MKVYFPRDGSLINPYQPPSTVINIINQKAFAMKPFQFFISLICLVFCFGKTAVGQSWAVGLHFGENFSTLRGYANTDYVPGFMGGVHASHYLTEHIVLRIEANFERKGARVETAYPNSGSPDFVDDYRFDYLSLPAMFRYSVGKKSKFVVGGGASVDYLIRQRTDYGEMNANERNDFRRFDTDLVGTVVGQFLSGKSGLFPLKCGPYGDLSK